MQKLFYAIPLLVFLLTAGMVSHAQMKRADQAFRHHNYPEAIELYRQAIRRDLDNDLAITRMAISLWRTNQLQQAEYWFTRAALMNDDPEVKLMYAQVLIANEKYAIAETWLGRYIEAQTDDEKAHHAKQLMAWAGGLAAGADLSHDLRVVPAPINSTDLDFAPVVHKGKLYFTTNRKGVVKRSGDYDPWTGQRFTDVYEATRLGENEFSEPVPAFGILATPAHEGPLVFSADGRELFLTTSDADERRRNVDPTNNTRVRIRHFLRDPDGGWKPSQPLPFVSSDYNTSHPALTHDGTTLVFASDRQGSIGGMDLFKVTRDAAGNWGSPEALPAHINTRGNEVFPYLATNGDLYFASNWHPGFGGLDLFHCVWDGAEWGLPQNMGRPINGSGDDFGLWLDEDGNSGFFSSNRNADQNDAILFFKRMVGVRIEGRLIDCTNQNPIANAKIELRGEHHYRDVAFTDGEGRFSFMTEPDQNYQLVTQHERFHADETCDGMAAVDTQGLENGHRVALTLAMAPRTPPNHTFSYLCGTVVNARYGNPLQGALLTLSGENGSVREVNTSGEGRFFIPAAAGETYELKLERRGFLPRTESVTIVSHDDQCHSIEVQLEPDDTAVPAPLSLDLKVEKGMVVELYHIYFDLASADLRADAFDDLETFYELLTRYPGMRGEIMAHTDARGDAAANLALSQRRADAVLQFLTQRGIDAERLTATGYGEQFPVNDCIDGVPCTESQHERNRRVEFRIVDLGDEVLEDRDR